MKPHLFLGLLLLAFLTPVLAQDAAEQPYARTPEELLPFRGYGEPYRLLFREPLAFRGAGRDKAPPEGLEEIRLGLLVPPEGSPEGYQGRGMRQGAMLAVEEANAGGGYTGLAFRVIEHADLPIWGASSNEIVAMAWEERVWAILGSVGGDSSHIAIRVALKAEVPVMNTATTDPTFTETGIPWAFRCIADDRQQGYALALHIFRDRGFKRVAAIRSNDRYGRFGIAELLDSARRLGHPLVAELKWLPGAEDYTAILEKVRRAQPDAVVVWGGAEAAAGLLKQMREMGLTQPVFGSAGLVDRRFLELAGDAAEGVVAAAFFDPTAPNPRYDRFRLIYEERFGEEPDAYAAHAYDGMKLVLQAIAEVGLNRPLIRDFLANVRESDGVTGPIIFDPTFNDVAPVPLAVVRDGEFRYELGTPTKPASQEGAATVGLLLGADDEADDVERGLRLALAESPAPPRLAVRKVTGPWTTAGELARDLMVDDGAAVLVSALDRAGSHVAAQVATKLRRPLVVAPFAEASSPRQLLAHTGVPWIHLLASEGVDVLVPAAFASRFRERYGVDPSPSARAGYRAGRQLLAVLAGS